MDFHTTALKRTFYATLACSALAAVAAHAALPRPDAGSQRGLSERLERIRDQVLGMQKDLLDGSRLQDQAREQMRRIRALLKLQKEEREVATRRMAELEKTVGELESRRKLLSERIQVRIAQVRTRLRPLGLGPAGRDAAPSPFLDQKQAWDAVTRQVQAALARSAVREIEELRVDIEDARVLERQIEEERQQLVYLFQDMQEQESVLQLNRQIQVDLIRREHQSRLAQLESYRRLKAAEAGVQKMLGEFNARSELQKRLEEDRARTRAERALEQGLFVRSQGRLPLPVAGRIVGRFGKSIDPQSRLQVFKKGIEIEAAPGTEVRAVAQGRVAFAGELPGYGRVLILDHGDHYYTLSGNLGELAHKAGDPVEAGAVLGRASGDGSRVYFEIRSRNIAVNPLQWVASSISLSP